MKSKTQLLCNQKAKFWQNLFFFQDNDYNFDYYNDGGDKYGDDDDGDDGPVYWNMIVSLSFMWLICTYDTGWDQEEELALIFF